jgi:PAS domain S-box-containing protein
VALRIENLRQRRALLAREQEIAELSAARDREAGRCARETRHAHDLLHYIIGNAESGIAVFDREMRYLYVSRRYLQELNAEGIDVIGKCHYDVFPEIPQVWREVHQKALRGEPSSAESDPFERADGSIYWTRWECLPWYDAEGGIGGIVLYTEVINEEMAAEEERRRLRSQLAQAQKMESIGRLAGGVAHDFNNLLTVINGYSAMALEHLHPGDPLVGDLREIRTAGERAAALTRQLLAFSRKQILQPRPLDLNQILRNLEPMLPRLLGERVRLRLSLYPDRLAVLADQHQLEQVILNLAVNARDAMPEGGGLTVETTLADVDKPVAIAQADAKPGRYAVLSVSDTGLGMDEATRLKIFEPFFTTKPAGEGTGLGLSMAHGIVAQSGGFIEVSSEPGNGSTFRVHLPLTEGEPSAAAGGEKPLARRGEETILVVEDQDEVRGYVVDALKSYGYRPIPCGSAAEALEICGKPECAIDLVLTDLVMPDMSGRELAQRLALIRSGIPVLLMSGYTGEALEQERPENAFFLQKPFSPAELAEKVSAALVSRRGPGGI